jgi:succinyl-CoA synthetase beta subunit
MGGIKVAETATEAGMIANNLLANKLNEFHVDCLLVEEKLNIAHEIYMSITVDASRGGAVAIVSAEGGVAIEEVAKRKSNRIFSFLINPIYGLRGYEAINLIRKIGLDGGLLTTTARILSRLYQAFSLCDARLVEVNPLVITNKGAVVAADSRVDIDDNSLFKHPELEEKYLQRIDNVWEREAMAGGVTYIDLEGDIAVMANGAGLTMALLDMVKDGGGSPACFLETGGGISKQRMKHGVKLLLEKAKVDSRIKVILVMARMMISPPDDVAEGLTEALMEVKVNTPIVAIMRGRKPYERRAKLLLKDSGIPIHSSLQDGIQQSIKLARG